MNVVETAIPGVMIVEPRVFGDDRGFFMETWQAGRYLEAGIPADFVQDNLSKSTKGVLRGLHFQNPNPQGKLVSVMVGSVFDVAVDIRQGSPTFGQWAGVTLTEDNKKQFYVPEGFAHGFQSLVDNTEIVYQVSEFYTPDSELGIHWNDPAFNIKWPVKEKIITEKDNSWKFFDVGVLE